MNDENDDAGMKVFGDPDVAQWRRYRKALELIHKLRPVRVGPGGRCSDPDCWPCKMWEIADVALKDVGRRVISGTSDAATASRTELEPYFKLALFLGEIGWVASGDAQWDHLRDNINQIRAIIG